MAVSGKLENKDMKTLTIELSDEVDEKEAKMTVASALLDKGTFRTSSKIRRN